MRDYIIFIIIALILVGTAVKINDRLTETKYLEGTIIEKGIQDKNGKTVDKYDPAALCDALHGKLRPDGTCA